MNRSVDRGLLTHAIIALGLCIGAWIFLVKPQIRQLQAAEAAVAADLEHSQEVNGPGLEKVGRRLQTVESRLSVIHQRNNLMHDPSRLYGQMMDLAAANSVSVQNLQPGPEKLSADATMAICRIDLTAEGAYEHVANFLDALTAIEGFIRPVALNLTPIRDDAHAGVTAQFSCEAISFKVPDALSAPKGTADKRR